MPYKDPLIRKAYIKEWQQREIPKKKKCNYMLKRRYGITLEQYNILLKKQQGKCALCGLEPQNQKYKFSVDHDHNCCAGRESCGKCVRGLLCVGCNTLVAQFEKMKGYFSQLEEYVTRRINLC